MAMFDGLKGFGVTFSTMFKKVVTEEYPEAGAPAAPPGYTSTPRRPPRRSDRSAWDVHRRSGHRHHDTGRHAGAAGRGRDAVHLD